MEETEDEDVKEECIVEIDPNEEVNPCKELAEDEENCTDDGAWVEKGISPVKWLLTA